MRASGYDRAAESWYTEPGWLVDDLIAAERPFDEPVWDPCCGEGNIPERLKAHGVMAVGSDIVDRGYGTTGHDFFETEARYASIISNPPFERSEEFVRRALALTTDRVCMLGRLAFLEGQARRDGLFTEHPPARVWVSSKRPSMPPGGRPDVRASGGSIAYAWYVWDHEPQCIATTLGWLGRRGLVHRAAAEAAE